MDTFISRLARPPAGRPNGEGADAEQLGAEQWMKEFMKLKSLNHKLLGGEAKLEAGAPTGKKGAKKK